MPSSLLKTRKHIAKKCKGEVNALHEKFRDSRRLHKASARDQRLEKLSAIRSKKEQPIVARVAFFQEHLKESSNSPFNLAAVQSLIQTFIHQHDEEYNILKKARRNGRPPSSKEDMLKMKISALEAEYQKGSALPDVMAEENVKLLREWEGSWPKLTTLAWIKVSNTGQVRRSDFPSKGIIN